MFENLFKKTIIEESFVALIFRAGKLFDIKEAGEYKFSKDDTLIKYSVSSEFQPQTALEVLLKNETLKKMLLIKDVTDGNISIMFVNGVFGRVLSPKKYAFWNKYFEYTFTDCSLSNHEIPSEIPNNILDKPELASFVRKFIVPPNNKGLLYADGKFVKIQEPGTYRYWQNSTSLELVNVDLRQRQLDISGQEILTKDKATLRINFFVQYKITDIIKAVNENTAFSDQLYVLIQLALREYIGTLTIDEILANKESVAEFVMNYVSKETEKLGVLLTNCGVKDIILPGDIKQILNSVLIAQKAAQANIITRREETASTRSLLNTAKLMEENEMLFKLKEMEFIEKIAGNISQISVSGGGQIVEQLKEIFGTNNIKKKKNKE